MADASSAETIFVLVLAMLLGDADRPFLQTISFSFSCPASNVFLKWEKETSAVAQRLLESDLTKRLGPELTDKI
jgi:hypothetical protein